MNKLGIFMTAEENLLGTRLCKTTDNYQGHTRADKDKLNEKVFHYTHDFNFRNLPFSVSDEAIYE